MSLAAAATVATLLIASPSLTDADRLAANGGFLLGNAQRCGIESQEVERAGRLIRGLIAAATADSDDEQAAVARFAAFFLVSAVADPKREKLVASCSIVKSELKRLEAHRVALAGAGE
ncbi:MAG TPA: hypothetical protein VJR70_12200 [Stellaceae bacterium]|nr:hypothetical protein [Stellaceae bacterium]